MHEIPRDPSGRRRRTIGLVIVIAGAVAMGAPTLFGGFVGGDDHRLVLNHVLVNRPSWPHAAELFRIVHRDLYQPLPLLSFSAEFALASALGLDRRGVEGFAWLFHLDNVLLHALNAVLVWFVVRTLHRRIAPDEGLAAPSAGTAWPMSDIVATAAALLFAIHPLQTETVAWVNGRMILMSTTFALASLLAFSALLTRPVARGESSPGRTVALGGLTVLLVLLSGVSKVRVGLVVLLFLVAAAHRALRSKRAVAVWTLCLGVTALLAWINVEATAEADLFSDAAEQLHGPRIVRVLLALACYAEHLFFPVGLSSHYPAPRTVRWGDPATVRAVLVVVPVLGLLAWACVRSSVARFGTLWAASTLASTLPIVPARNILAADRYMYLSIIGLLWIVAAQATAAYRARRAGWSIGLRRVVAPAIAAGVCVALVAMCWHVSWYYADPLRKTARIAMLVPDEPRVWERLGWAHYKVGHYERAMEFAAKELDDDAPAVRSGALQLLGMCELKRGDGDAAIRHLQQAIAVDPDTSLGRYRLAMAYDELGRVEAAIPHYEAAVAAAPLRNPVIDRLASAYRRVGRLDDARRMYDQAIESNPYDVSATLGLSELDIALRTAPSLRAAESRLRALLDWMPENTAARVDLGAVLYTQDRKPEAVAMYERALRDEPGNVTAAVNLGQIYDAGGDDARAAALYGRAVGAGLESVEQAVIVQDHYGRRGDVDAVRSLWAGMADRFPGSLDVRLWIAFTDALRGDIASAKETLDQLDDDTGAAPMGLATLAYVSFVKGDGAAATAPVDRLCAVGGDDMAKADARRRLLAALERYDAGSPGNALTYCFAAKLLRADGRDEPADHFIDLCEQHCAGASCAAMIAELRRAPSNE